VTYTSAVRIMAVPRSGYTNAGLQAIQFAEHYRDEIWVTPAYGDELPTNPPARFFILDRKPLRKLLPATFIRRASLPWFFFRMMFRRSRFYIIHNVLFAFPAYLLGCRYSLFIHGFDKRFLDTRWGRAVARGATDVYGVGFGLKDPDLTVTEIPNIFTPAELGSPPPIQHDVIFVLRYAPNKNPLYAIDLAEHVPGLDILVVGVSPDEMSEKDRRRLARLQAQGSKIQYVGRKSYSELVTLLHASRILFSPSFSEGIPKAVLEAMSLGMHVMANPYLPLPTAFADCVQRVELDDWESIAAAVERARASPRSDANKAVVRDYLQQSRLELKAMYDDLYRRQLGFVPSPKRVAKV